MKRHRLHAIIAGFGLAMIIALPAARAASLQAAIEAVNAKFGAAYNAHDAGAIAALYTEDATVFPPGQDMVQGRDGIRKVWAGMIDSGARITSLKTVSVEQLGQAAREIGRFSVEMPNAGKPATPLAGKYLVIWKQVNGTWKLDCDIWNMNK